MNSGEIRADLLRALLYIEENLGGDLRLENTARRAGLSPAHFHRLFRARIGETLQKYVERLRLEKSRRLLRISELSILEIALECGYNSHENFTRRFTGRFGESPRALRARENSAVPEDDTGMPHRGTSPENAAHTRPEVVRLRDLHLAFIRLRGDYYKLPPIDPDAPGVWRDLRETAADPGVFIGICHDDPSVTPPEKIRFDACIQTAPVEAQGESPGYRRIPGGYFARATHLGDSRTLHLAYGALAEYARGLKMFTFADHPPFEIYLEYTTEDIARTEIYFALSKAR